MEEEEVVVRLRADTVFFMKYIWLPNEYLQVLMSRRVQFECTLIADTRTYIILYRLLYCYVCEALSLMLTNHMKSKHRLLYKVCKKSNRTVAATLMTRSLPSLCASVSSCCVITLLLTSVTQLEVAQTWSKESN